MAEGKMPAWPKASEEKVKVLDSNMAGKAERRQMFGHPCYFFKGNMIAGVFGDHIFLRLPASTMQNLESSGEAAPFEPIKGRIMAGYVQLKDPSPALFQEALHHAMTLPEKKAKKK
jgi:TfoX/Sxy family transcriptional regulator of competence genes